MNVVVLVEMATADSAPEPAAALVETCREGMKGRGTCLIAEAPRQPSATETYAVAVVTWDGPAHKQARVEIGFREGARTDWRNRSIAFVPQDPDLERWRSVGFAIATLVGEGLSAAPPDAGVIPTARPDAQTTSEARVEPARPAPDALEGRRVAVDAAFVVGRGAATHSPSMGASLDASIRIASNWSVQLGTSYAVQNVGTDDLTIRWISGSAGASGSVRLTSSLALEGRLQAHLVHVRGDATDPATTGAGDAATWLVGARAGVGCSWMFSDRFGAVVGADATLTPGTTEFVAHGQPLARIAPFDVSAHAGLRFAL